MKDWLRIFLPFWAIGSLCWVITGFILYPNAFRRPVLYSAHGVWTSQLYDLTNIDMEVAQALSLVLGPPTLLILIALAVVAVEQLRGLRGPGKR